ncbi:hypothetical protein BCR36DRAFT_408631 [Piromyces finnis]|uniref:Uncharacterized protein n=1 Tax=Piromyces finnis TaxID=1754191 RepID=A0A1Y1VKV3_9FUNG|nr:hypothetical protein BCR36DRAFT_408631 [Piromyces finnis]|eukprot:ORX59098.1 hypothetical protein BCR36DRAFT_408631 [Piromyces finnis]
MGELEGLKEIVKEEIANVLLYNTVKSYIKDRITSWDNDIDPEGVELILDTIFMFLPDDITFESFLYKVYDMKGKVLQAIKNIKYIALQFDSTIELWEQIFNHPNYKEWKNQYFASIMETPTIMDNLYSLAHQEDVVDQIKQIANHPNFNIWKEEMINNPSKLLNLFF